MDSAYIKFNGGIWSEQLKGRYDLGNYKSAARTCENFIPTRYGQVEKRAGTKHLGFAKEFLTGEASRKCVLVPFQFSVNTKFILEMGDQYIRFWSNDLQVDVEDRDTVWATTTAYVVGDAVTESGTTYTCITAHTSDATTFATDAANWYALTAKILEVETPYLEAELYEIQTRAVNDVVYITHPNHPVGKLTRLADDNWTYDVADLDLPFVDPDVNSFDVTITSSDVNGTVTLTASEDLWDSSYVGSEIRLRHIDEGDIKSFGSTGYPATVPAFSPTTVYATGNDVYDNAGAPKRYMFDVVEDYDPSAVWASGTYAINDLVTFGGSVYICVDPHTSADDPTVNTGDWSLVTKPQNAPFYFEDGIKRADFTLSEGWSFQTRGIWNGIWSLQRSTDGGTTFVTIKSLSSTDDQNYLVEENEDGEEVIIRVKQIAIPDDTSKNMPATFTQLSGSRYGIAEITAVTDSLDATATVRQRIFVAGEPTLSWQESAFSPRQGYPRTITLFDNRLVVAGTAKKPQGFFYSGISDYENFTGGTLADSPFFVETLSDDQSSVQWLATQRELFIGTESIEGVLTTRKQDEAQSPENLPIVRWNESMGSAHRAALPLRDSLLILQRGRTTLNILAYSLERDGYSGEEVSLLCPQLFSSGVLQMTHQREPYTGAFTVQEDGTIAHMIYEPKLEVTGWCKYTTQGGNFESIAVLPSSLDDDVLWGSKTDEDDLWCVVERTINGTTRRHIERFTTGNVAKQEAGEADNLYYLDAAVKATGTGLTSVSGLDHLEGETVCVLADGIKGSYIVSGGSITLSVAADTVIVGLPVTSTFEPFDLEMQFKQDNTFSKRKQLYDSKLLVWRSLGGSIASDGEDYKDLIYHVAGETMDESVPLKDEWIEIFHESAHSRQKFWRIRHDEPYPFTLQAVVQTFTVSKH